MLQSSVFTISLDFELYWGVRDVYSIQQYGNNILGGRQAIPKMLSLFERHGIRATWATVGLLTFSNKKELLSYLPDVFPEYLDKNLDPYAHLANIGQNEKSDPYHYGYSLVSAIQETQGMELASHSFSHFYCLEPRRNKNAYQSDLASSLESMKRFGTTPSSIVFCRNQYDTHHLNDALNSGFKVFRGNEVAGLYAPRSSKESRLTQRIGRIFDSYVNLTGFHCSDIKKDLSGLINVPASRFLRPASSGFESLRLRRITQAMTYAAQSGSAFHLWWHPHNFGANVQKNMIFLEKIILHFHHLQDKFGMVSLSMSEAANHLLVKE